MSAVRARCTLHVSGSRGFRAYWLHTAWPLIDVEQADDWHLESGYAAMARILERGDMAGDMTAVFCAGDLLAMGAMRALLDAGRRIPEDVSVIGN